MLPGDQVYLRARTEADVPVLHAELHEDVPTRVRAMGRSWRPVSLGSGASPFRVSEPTDDTHLFSVVETASDDLAGDALLWGIDRYQRLAHLGLSLRPAFRGRGLAGDIVRVLCRYGFQTLGLHRLQVETLADNAAMRSAATRAGFTLEGTLRRAAWVDGQFLDEVVLGLLVEEWSR